ncbi:MAG: ATP-binding cassette domain-containing protein [Candidatus Nitrosocosmicus sp.]
MKLELINISKSYTGFKLGPINIKVTGAVIHVLMGATGSGKSTLLNIVTGLVKPDTGKVLIDGENITNKPIESRKIGYCFQKPCLFPHLNVYKNLVFGLSKSDRNNMATHLEKLVQSFELNHLLERNTEDLSGGEMQKVSLARMLVLKPKIMLLDEPLAHLDSLTKNKLRMDIRNILVEEKVLALYVTHFKEDVYALADNVSIIQWGQLVRTDTLSTFFSRGVKNHSTFYHYNPDIFESNHNYIEGRVIETKSGTSVFMTGDFKIEIMGEFPLGSVVGIMVKPEDVIISKEQVKTSARNSIKTVVAGIIKSPTENSSVVEVYLDIHSDSYLRSKITVESKNELEISKGDTVYAIFKATAPEIIRKEILK